MWLRWLILILLGWLILRLARKLFSSPELPGKKAPREIQDEMVQDPVCGVYVPKKQAVVLQGAGQEKRYFCSTRCRDQFLQERKDAS
jgi:uncharacterized protein